jgi:hypothetical protein
LSEQHAIAFERFRDREKTTIRSGISAWMKVCSDILAAPAGDASRRVMARRSGKSAALLLDRPATRIGFQA